MLNKEVLKKKPYVDIEDIFEGRYNKDEMLGQLDDNISYDAIRNILHNKILYDFQALDAITGLVQKKCIMNQATGTGKTTIASALCVLLHNRFPDKKILFLIKNNQLLQTPKKVSDDTGLSVITSSGEKDSIQKFCYHAKFLDYDISMITHECMNSYTMMRTLFTYQDEFICLICDEAHELQNYKTSYSGQMALSMFRNFEYCYALTATPIRSDIKTFTRLMRVVDNRSVDKEMSVIRLISTGDGNEAIQDNYGAFIITRTRDDIGADSTYIEHPVFIKPTTEQLQCTSYMDNLDLFKGSNADNSINELLKILEEQKDKKGLIYIKHHEIREGIIPRLNDAGIRFECINGRVIGDERSRIVRDFNNTDKYQMLIISIEEAVDLDCDYIIFYEMTSNYKQVIGRGERGLNPKVLHLYFMLVENTLEENRFMDLMRIPAKRNESILRIPCRELDSTTKKIYRNMSIRKLDGIFT